MPALDAEAARAAVAARVQELFAAAVAGVGLAFTLAAARSVVFASTVPPSERAFAFLFCLRGATPVYAVPLVIGLQYDCWRTRSERRERALGLRSRGEGFSAHDAADMG